MSSKRVNSQHGIPSLLESTTTIRKGRNLSHVSLTPLGVLLLESARRYRIDPRSFGKKRQTFDFALKKPFRKIFRTKWHRDAFDRGIKVYDKLIGQVDKKIKRNKGGRSCRNCLTTCYFN